MIGLLMSATATPAISRSADYSLRDRAKWRSFGGDKDWLFDDPFERAKPGAVRQPYTAWELRRNTSKTGQLLDLIGFAEAGRLQYDAVHMSADRRPPARPTQLTLSQIMYWIRKTPGQHHAIGRYQFIPSTLLSLVRRAGISTSTTFAPGLQDKLALHLLADAGYREFLRGELPMSRFMDNLARIWAGLPTRNGRSAYHGYAGNRATISRKFYAEQMTAIFAGNQRGARKS